ncbi:Cleavage and polyadenylation specificity factor (CPSF) A subunit protein isoform 1 [Hibiscus syriacus]|uniref:Dirigent protein n=1 Tax=Hibiscus syriacus TaxID=106335 RepID=A0A6A2XHI6_HIBSY|nr:dirigent protein 18-like [Hibiscus syriacus]KAE8669230.1 Cleavage and polyadenylation specificity factor (CPSF) A subunit protein isoform 1 [Hibiscus syriacus]
MANLPCLLIFFITIVNNSSSSGNLENPSSNHHHHHGKHHKISFSMPNLLNISRPPSPQLTSQLPFSKPLGLFPPNKGIPIREPDPKVRRLERSIFRTSDCISRLGLLFRSWNSARRRPLGKAQGVYVASSEVDAGHMMAMTTVFADGGFKDGLRFFGLHRRDVSESHIAVIGGTGKYAGANGYATVKVVKQGVNMLLLFNVHLS